MRPSKYDQTKFELERLKLMAVLTAVALNKAAYLLRTIEPKFSEELKAQALQLEEASK